MKIFSKTLPKISALLVLGLLLTAVVFPARMTFAQNGGTDSLTDICSNVTGGDKPAACTAEAKQCGSAQAQISNLNCKSANPIVVTILKTVSILDYVIGIAAVLVIIIAGLRYTLSRGDSGQVETAKNTILYALVGLAIAIVAQGIIAFALRRI